MSLLSVIVPCYNEEESVALFYQELTKNDTFFKASTFASPVPYVLHRFCTFKISIYKYLLSYKDRSNSLQSDEFNLTIP